jgi:hypothetical protein
MQLKKIMVPVDGSEFSMRATGYAVDMPSSRIVKYC